MKNVFEELDTLKEPRRNTFLTAVMICLLIWAAIFLVGSIATAAGPHPDCQYTEGMC